MIFSANAYVDRVGLSSTLEENVLHVTASDPRVKVVVIQVGAMDVNQIIRSQTSQQQFAALEQMTVQERKNSHIR